MGIDIILNTPISVLHNLLIKQLVHITRRRRKQFFDLFDFDEENFLFGHEPLEGESGYSISITYDAEGKPVVRVKTSGTLTLQNCATISRRDIQEPESKDWRRSR